MYKISEEGYNEKEHSRRQASCQLVQAHHLHYSVSMAFLGAKQGTSNVDSNHDISTAARRLRQLLADDKNIVVAPGVYDGLTARIALAAGHQCLYMTGAGTSVSRLGLPDMGFLTLNDMHANAAMIAGLDKTVPVIADADTGFGGPLQVGRTVSLYMSAGVAGLHIEDQVLAKRCGHLAGKQTVSLDEFLGRISAAVMARKREGGDIVIIARSDALQQYGYEEAVARLRAAIKLGADVAFLEGVESIEQAEQAVADLAPTPLLFNVVPGGVSPDLSVQQAQDLGFRVVIFPGAALGPVALVVKETMSKLKTTGYVGSIGGQRTSSPHSLFEVCGLTECLAFDRDVAANTLRVQNR